MNGQGSLNSVEYAHKALYRILPKVSESQNPYKMDIQSSEPK